MTNDKGRSDTGNNVTPSTSTGADSQQNNPEPSLGQQISTVASMIGKGWVKSDTGLWNDANYQGTGEEANRSLFTDNYDYQKMHKQATAMLNRIDQSVHPARVGNHLAVKMPICTENAIIQCAMGSVLSKLHIMDPLRKPVIGTTIKNRCAVVTDCIPGLNFDGFGACWNILNPAVAAATLAASIAAGTFVLTPMPCLATMMPGPWIPILGEMISFCGKPVLVQPSVCNCWGLGFITISHCGQGLDASPVRFTNEKGEVDWHLVATLSANVLATVLSGGASVVAKAAQAANAARVAEATVASVRAGQTARMAELSAQAAKYASIADKATKVAKVGDIGSNVITLADGALYVAEGKTAEAIMSFAGMGVSSTVSAVGDRLAKRAAGSSENLANAFRNTLDPSAQSHFDDILRQGSNPDFIKDTIKKNPDIYGDLSHMPDADLEALIRNSNPYKDADSAIDAARGASNSADAAKAKANTQHNAAKAAQSTDDALEIARVEAHASKEAANNAKEAAEALRKASQKAEDATNAYTEALIKIDDIDKDIREMTEQLSKLDPNSPEYRQLASQIETEKLKRFTANVDVQTRKTDLDKASGEYIDVKVATREQYHVDSVEDMDKIAKDLQDTANTKANTVTQLEQQHGILNEQAGGKTVAETEEALNRAQQTASDAENALDDALLQQQAQQDFADAAAVAEADAAAANKASTVGTLYSVGNSVVSPSIGNVISTDNKTIEGYEKYGYGLSAEEQAMLANLDKE